MISKNDVDILAIDCSIIEKFTKEQKKIDLYKDKLSIVEKIVNDDTTTPELRDRITIKKNEIEKCITDLENNNNFNFYKVETTELIDAYNKILLEPITVSFIGKNKSNNNEKTQIIRKYLDIAKKYIDVNVELKNKKAKIKCDNCSNKKDFDSPEDNVYICLNCSSEQLINKNASSYKDIDRVNITSKYMYDRKIHFRDSISQYLARQNSTVADEVYSSLIEEFENHGLLVGDKDTHNKTRFSKITKEHIMIFLKERGFSKHYENVNLIYVKLTGVKPPNISHIEDKLFNDFDSFTEMYDKIYHNINRKNFINSQYLLHKLLIRHKFNCKADDFSILKTVERKAFHDEICEAVFRELNWTFIP